jgi:hypothetical protein
MRALAKISAMVLLGAGLTSCDMPGSHERQAALTPPPCNCATTPPAAMTSPPAEHLRRFSYAPRHHYIRHRYYAQYVHSRYRSRYDVDYSQQTVDAYDYVSSSHVTRSAYSRSGYAGGYYAGGYEDGYGSRRIVWVDGYGRGYFSNGPVTVAATMRGKRLDPYHGYNADCPDDGEPR